jgi:hypothetical protein
MACDARQPKGVFKRIPFGPSCPVQLLGFLNYNCLRFHVVVLVRCQAPYARVKLLQLWLQPVCMMIMWLSDLLKLKLRLSKA